MKGFTGNIETLTRENQDYRRVLYTTHGLQLVLMSIKPGDEIGEEVHGLDQFIRVEEGTATVTIDGTPHLLTDDHVVIIPRGTMHNVVNTGTVPLKLYSIYGPAEHKDGTVHATKADDAEEHFDGHVSA